MIDGMNFVLTRVLKVEWKLCPELYCAHTDYVTDRHGYGG